MVALLAFLASPLGKFCGYAAAALALLITCGVIKAEWDQGRAAVHQVAEIRHISAVQTKAVTKADTVVAKADDTAQAKIVTETRIIHERIPVYVTVRTPCIPWSLVRLHDAAVAGVDPSTLQAPAGAADDACSDVAPSAFVATVVDNYAAARANAQQLNDLEADANARAQAVVAPATTGPPAP